MTGVAAGVGGVSGGVRWLVRLEAFAVMTLAICAYARTGTGWQTFAVLFLVPDVSFAGYLGGARIGAATYNFAHSYVMPLLFLAAGTTLLPWLLPYALIWIAHVGFDRTLGYGLKYASGFRDTHLGRIGKGE